MDVVQPNFRNRRISLWHELQLLNFAFFNGKFSRFREIQGWFATELIGTNLCHDGAPWLLVPWALQRKSSSTFVFSTFTPGSLRIFISDFNILPRPVTRAPIDQSRNALVYILLAVYTSDWHRHLVN